MQTEDDTSAGMMVVAKPEIEPEIVCMEGLCAVSAEDTVDMTPAEYWVRRYMNACFSFFRFWCNYTGFVSFMNRAHTQRHTFYFSLSHTHMHISSSSSGAKAPPLAARPVGNRPGQSLGP